MGSFYDDVLQPHPRFRDTAPVGDLALLEPETRRRVEAVIADAAAEGVALMAFETYRSKERQQLLFQQKVTKLQTVGVHHYGLACDIVRSVGGHPSWKGDFSIVGRLARKHGLVWGGDWGRPGVTPSFVDPVHVQRCTVGRQKLLFAGSWYPDDAYNPWDELAAAAPRALRRRRPAKRVRKRTTAKSAAPNARSTGATRKSPRKSASPKSAPARGAAAKDGATKRGATKRGAAKRGAAKRGAAKRASARKSGAKNATAKRTRVKRAGARRSSTRRGGRRT